METVKSVSRNVACHYPLCAAEDSQKQAVMLGEHCLSTWARSTRKEYAVVVRG